MLNVKMSGFAGALTNLRKEMASMKKDGYVTVGIHSDAAGTGKMSNSSIGAANHFGTSTIPARPWLDVGAASVSDDIADASKDGIAEDESSEQILAKMGAVATAGVQEYMTDLSSPPNSKATIKRKGSSNPLIDTRELLRSVSFKVTKDTPKEGL